MADLELTEGKTKVLHARLEGDCTDDGREIVWRKWCDGCGGRRISEIVVELVCAYRFWQFMRVECV